MGLEIRECDEITAEVEAAFQRLVPQLSSSNPPPGRSELIQIVESPATVLFVACDGNEIVGTLTLVLFRIPTGLRAWIEDVVVDERWRGKGVGEALSRAAVERARTMGARTVDLTSRPNRESANRLYRSLGFEQRDTNVLRFPFDR